MTWIAIGCLVFVTAVSFFWLGYIFGAGSGLEAARIETRLWQGLAADLTDKLNECNGVVNPPVEAGK